MTADAFIKIINEQPKGAVIMMVGDDGVPSLYVKENEAIDVADIKKYGTEEADHVLISRGFILNKKTGKRDIPVKTYRSLTTVREIMVLENIKDKKNIDIHDLYSI